MDNPLGHPIAYGRTAEIYAWENGQVLKLYYDWFELENIQYEQRIARAVQASGLPVPRVGEIIQVKGRNGLIYQRIEGVSMLAMMRRKPWNVFFYARRMADLHARMHDQTILAEIPSLRQQILYKISRAPALSADLRLKTLALLEKLPEGDRLCHGDFHPDNILITARRDVVIDWIDSSQGNPLADLARTAIITMGAVEMNQLKNQFLNLFIRVFHRTYLQRYFSIHPGGKDEYALWLPIVAAARLSENIAGMEGWLIAQVEKGLM